jgi:hypothetical protein
VILVIFVIFVIFVILDTVGQTRAGSANDEVFHIARLAAARVPTGRAVT